MRDSKPVWILVEDTYSGVLRVHYDGCKRRHEVVRKDN